jgi:hypothetical protein
MPATGREDSLAVFTCDVNRDHEKNRAFTSRVHRCPAPSNNILVSHGVTFRGNSSYPSELALTKQYLIAPIRIPQPANPHKNFGKPRQVSTARRRPFEPPTDNKRVRQLRRQAKLNAGVFDGGPGGARRAAPSIPSAGKSTMKTTIYNSNRKIF